MSKHTCGGDLRKMGVNWLADSLEVAQKRVHELETSERELLKALEKAQEERDVHIENAKRSGLAAKKNAATIFEINEQCRQLAEERGKYREVLTKSLHHMKMGTFGDDWLKVAATKALTPQPNQPSECGGDPRYVKCRIFRTGCEHQVDHRGMIMAGPSCPNLDKVRAAKSFCPTGKTAKDKCGGKDE